VRAAGIRLGAALACLGAATLLVLFALDTHAWSSRLPADDLRYRRDASTGGLWRLHELAPGGIARRVLGIEDDLDYRRGLRDFRIGRSTEPVSSPSITTHRIAAQVELTQIAATSTDPVLRSQADNLLGVLGFGLGTQDIGARNAFFNNAITAFRTAAVLDPSNDDAFFNLEYALDQLRGTGALQAPGSSQFGVRGQAGLKSPGRGY
jgi:hypothetical protein